MNGTLRRLMRTLVDSNLFIGSRGRRSAKRESAHRVRRDRASDGIAKINGVSGDDFEFGLWRGKTFKHAHRMMRRYSLHGVKLRGFDRSRDSRPTSPARNGIGDSSRTLVRRLADAQVKAAVVYIDCDLYESTRPVLRFMSHFLQNGTIVCFDDYFNYKGPATRAKPGHPVSSAPSTRASSLFRTWSIRRWVSRSSSGCGRRQVQRCAPYRPQNTLSGYRNPCSSSTSTRRRAIRFLPRNPRVACSRP